MQLAQEIQLELPTASWNQLKEITDYVIDARYDDPDWASRVATQQQCQLCLEFIRTFTNF